jgi:quercetin dioxygenase-like cupin family protein
VITSDTPSLGAEVATGAFPVQPDEGEKMLFRAGPMPCLITVKVSPTNSPSSGFTVGTWEFPVDYVIPMHKHAREHEILFFTRGRFAATVNGAEIPATPGTTLNLPPGAWHEVRNTGGEPGEMVWFVSPAGVEGFFRETSQPPGIPWSPLPPAVIGAAAARYGLTLRADSQTAGEAPEREPGSPRPDVVERAARTAKEAPRLAGRAGLNTPSEASGDPQVEELVPQALSILAEEIERWRAARVENLLSRNRGADPGPASSVNVSAPHP